MSQPTSEPEPVRCPFCQATDAQLISLFGSQLLMSQYRCGGCGSYFEGLRDDRWEASPRQEAPRAASPRQETLREASPRQETPHGR
jgi:hypothetical protein